MLLCICLLGAAAGLRDELLWAKQQWPELTLEFPWQAFKEEADRIQRGEETSLDGPNLDLPARVAEAEARCVRGGVSVDLGGKGGGGEDSSVTGASKPVLALTRMGARTPVDCPNPSTRRGLDVQTLLLVHCRGSKLHPDLLEVTPADTSHPHPKAVAALACHECQALAARLWEDMVAWVNAHGEAPGRTAVAQYARDLCQYEVRSPPRASAPGAV